MGLKSGRRGSESRFSAYVEALISALGHADRAVPFHSSCAGLLLPGDRKSVEPMVLRNPALRPNIAEKPITPPINTTHLPATPNRATFNQ